MSRSGYEPSCDFTASEKTEIYSALPEKAAVPAPEGRKKGKYRVALIWLFAVFAVSMLITVWQQMTLYSMEAEKRQLSRELNELRSEKSLLQIEYEEQFNLSELERIAKEELGMYRPGAEQLIPLEIAAEPEPVAKESGFISKIGGRIRAYLHLG